MLLDVRRLASGSAGSSRDPVVEASSQVQGARIASRLSTSSSRSSDSSSTPGREARRRHPKRVLPVAQIAGAAPRVVKVKRKRALKLQNVPGFRGENFIPWVPVDADGPRDLEEEERMERAAGLLNRYVVRKRKRQVSSSEESDAVPVQFAKLSQSASDDQPVADKSSRDRAITIPGSPELGPMGESKPVGVGQPKLNIDDPAPRALQVILPPDQGEELPSKLKFTRSGLPKPTCPVKVLTLNYLPPRGPEPPRVEISAPGVEEVKGFLCR